MSRHGQGTAGPYDCTCGYPGSSAQDLAEHLIESAKVDDREQHQPGR